MLRVVKDKKIKYKLHIKLQTLWNVFRVQKNLTNIHQTFSLRNCFRNIPNVTISFVVKGINTNEKKNKIGK